METKKIINKYHIWKEWKEWCSEQVDNFLIDKNLIMFLMILNNYNTNQIMKQTNNKNRNWTQLNKNSFINII